MSQTPESMLAQLSGPNLAYIVGLYEQYLENPTSVDQETGAWLRAVSGQLRHTEQAQSGVDNGNPRYIDQILSARDLVHRIRQFGHLSANLSSQTEVRADASVLQPETYGLNDHALSEIPARFVWREAPSDVGTAREAVRRLKEIYTGTTAFDFSHVVDLEEQEWLQTVVESCAYQVRLSPEKQQQLLRRLSEVEGFERFLHRTFAGQKRFSLEGLDALVPMLDALIHHSVAGGAREILIGMAHRGRLNVLAHVLNKPYDKIFAEFQSSPNKEMVPSEGSEGIHMGWTGDVKYHLGAYRTVSEGGPGQARITLANNPSHLEFVNPVVAGFARAAQDKRDKGGPPSFDPDAALAVLVHGDAAFPGEGVVAETFNFSRIPGYRIGGSIHIIGNNRLGFTAEESEARSTHYASDLAKGFEVPVVHVNADDPEACLTAIRLAYAYRQKFHKDFLVDLIGYRRWGHNEMDDPSVTQPLLYKEIGNRPTVRLLYGATLTNRGVIAETDIKRMEDEAHQTLREAYARIETTSQAPTSEVSEAPTQLPAPVSIDTLRTLNDAMLVRKAGFTVYPKLARTLDKRKDALKQGGKVAFAHAEALAFATILASGTPIRMTGQDAERGTFAHRHLVLHDFDTNEVYVPLQSLPQARASFAIHNSPLTETAVVGFEYGYNVHAADTFVLWEAQFGDFANVAQVMIDQFIVSGRAKWGEPSGLVLLLPHGYEGQGPEHSNARPERILQLAADNNITVANASNAAQYFHLLRRQAARLGKSARPLVVFTPKSLLRNPRAASAAEELAYGSFQNVLPFGPTPTDASMVRRFILASGKVTVEFDGAVDEHKGDVLSWLACVKVEQLYPCPVDELERQMALYPNVQEVVWMQEEPENMGAWRYIQPYLQQLLPNGAHLRYIGRPAYASTAEGHAPEHNQEQARILREALTR